MVYYVNVMIQWAIIWRPHKVDAIFVLLISLFSYAKIEYELNLWGLFLIYYSTVSTISSCQEIYESDTEGFRTREAASVVSYWRSDVQHIHKDIRWVCWHLWNHWYSSFRPYQCWRVYASLLLLWFNCVHPW